MKKKIIFTIIFTIVILMLSACGSPRFDGTWTGSTGNATPWRYEFNRDGTGAWGDIRNIATGQVWNADLGRYVTPWVYNVTPTTWSISGDTLEITVDRTGQVNTYHFEFIDNDTVVVTREGWSTGLTLMRLE